MQPGRSGEAITNFTDVRYHLVIILILQLNEKWHLACQWGFHSVICFRLQKESWGVYVLSIIWESYTDTVLKPDIPLKSVKCFPGGRKIDLIPSIFEILSQTWYYLLQYTKHQLLTLIHTASIVSTKVVLFEHAIYSWDGLHCLQCRSSKE